MGPPGRYSNLIHARGMKHGQLEIRGFKIRSDEYTEYLKQKYDADEIGVVSYINPSSFLRSARPPPRCGLFLAPVRPLLYRENQPAQQPQLIRPAWVGFHRLAGCL